MVMYARSVCLCIYRYARAHADIINEEKDETQWHRPNRTLVFPPKTNSRLMPWHCQTASLYMRKYHGLCATTALFIFSQCTIPKKRPPEKHQQQNQCADKRTRMYQPHSDDGKRPKQPTTTMKTTKTAAAAKKKKMMMNVWDSGSM